MRGLRSREALAALGLAAALAYLVSHGFDRPAVKLLVKPLPVLCLAVALAPWRSLTARLVAAGLVASAVGDLLLELPGRFVHGMGAFGLAHLSYTGAFVSVSRALHPARLLAVVAWSGGLWFILQPGLGDLAVPVAIYAALIATMMWRASEILGSSAGAWAAVGALLFGLSDSLIALDRFHAPIAGVRVPIMLLYWAGQLGIARWAATSSSPRISERLGAARRGSW